MFESDEATGTSLMSHCATEKKLVVEPTCVTLDGWSLGTTSNRSQENVT